MASSSRRGKVAACSRTGTPFRWAHWWSETLARVNMTKVINGYGSINFTYIEQAMKKLSIVFPVSFVKLLTKFSQDGGRPENDNFLIKFPGRSGYYMGCISAFLWFDPNYEHNIVNQHLAPPNIFLKAL